MHNELVRVGSAPLPIIVGDPGQSLSGREILDTLFRQKWRIILLWSIILALTLAYIFFTPYVYESEMTMLVKERRVEVDLGVDRADKADTGVSDTQMATEMQLLSGRELLREVVLKTGLTKSNAAGEIDRATGKLKKALHISPILKSSLIQVKYTDTNAKRAARVLQALADGYMNRHLELHSSPGSFQFFSREAEEYEKRLREAHDRLLEFQARTKIVLLPEQKDLTLRKMLEVEASLREAEALKAENELRIAKLQEQLGATGGRITTQTRKIPNQYSVERLNTLLAELQNKKTELLTKFRPEDRMIKQVDQQIADTRKALEAASTMSSSEVATDVNPLRQSIESELNRAEVTVSGLNARITELSKQIGQYRGELSKLESATPDDQHLLQEVNVAEQNYILYSKKREEARIAQEMDRQKIANVVLVDPPRVPAFPQSKLGSGVPAAFLLGSILIVALCFALGHRRNVVHTPWELEASTGLPVLATIPLSDITFLPARGGPGPLLELEGQIEK